MAIKHYLVELTTQIGVVVDDKEVSATKSLYQLVVDKTQSLMNDQDLNDKNYNLKLIAEG
jgi:hypothetical protein